MSKYEWTNADQLYSITQAYQYTPDASNNQIIDKKGFSFTLMFINKSQIDLGKLYDFQFHLYFHYVTDRKEGYFIG